MARNSFKNLLKNTKKRWTERDKAFLNKHAGNMKDKEIASRLNKTIKSIREMRHKLNLKKQSGRGIVALRKKDKNKDN